MSGRLANRNGERTVRVNGGRSRDRTYDLPIKSRLLYQLSYAPIHGDNLYITQEHDIVNKEGRRVASGTENQ